MGNSDKKISCTFADSGFRLSCGSGAMPLKDGAGKNMIYMMKSGEIYYLIGKLLALGPWRQEQPGRITGPASSIQKVSSIKTLVQTAGIDWQKFVQIASNNYVLQTLYPKFTENGLAGLLPADLQDHLRDIHRLNHERNDDILNYCNNINSILVSRNIIPVFMKGAGNLVDGLYYSQGERIMADIDILTRPDKMEAAAELLIREGYRPFGSFHPAKAKTIKHYPLLLHDDLPAFVEIHRMPVNIQFAAHFDHTAVFREMRPALNAPDLMVMSDSHKILLSFFHSQLVHWGYYHARPSLRELYDLFLLSHRKDPSMVYSSMPRFRGKAAGYLKVMQKIFDSQQALPDELKGKGNIYLIRHDIALTSPRTGRVLYRILKLWRLFISIPVSGLFSRNHRLYMMARLKDREWYRRNLLPFKGPKAKEHRKTGKAQ